MRYYLLDGARCNDALDDTLQQAPKHMSLYKGRSEENLASVAPYLIDVNTTFEQWILKNGWGKSWGYFLESELPFEAVYSHFRKFLIVENEDFTQFYFRFYDPRVIRLFLPTCDTKQLQAFLAPVDLLMSETPEEESKVALFRLESGKLKVDYDAIQKYFEPPSLPSDPSTNTSTIISEQGAISGVSQKEANDTIEETTKTKRKFIY
jgi:hypothetical protein